MNESSQLSIRKLWIVGGLLALQAALAFGISLEERIPSPPRFEAFPAQLGKWSSLGDESLDAATVALLKPDQSLTRGYRHPEFGPASVFAGYFKTSQANHPAPHSPTVCLPGAGWKERRNVKMELLDSMGERFPLNEYVLEKSGQQLLVLYWYQNGQRAWADSVWTKVYILPDFLRYRRTDLALVRLTLISDLDDEALKNGLIDLARHVHPAVKLAFGVSGEETVQGRKN